ncbi:MAG TPA: hypothetical protein VGB59_07860 [Allosphingosinicella sp.]|jgi:hypothetical protein
MIDKKASKWLSGLPAELAQRIQEAIKQFEADERYEKSHGKLAGTIRRLGLIEEHCRPLIAAIHGLSPVGMASIHEEGAKRGFEIGRHELEKMVNGLESLAEIALLGADRLLSMHSPLPDEGQGAGSAIGRDSDLRAVKAQQDWQEFHFEFRSPKDKFGLRVLKAYLRHFSDFDVSARGAGRAIDTFLREAWNEVCPGHSTDWKRVVRARHAVAARMAPSLAGEKVWRRTQEERNASSH